MSCINSSSVFGAETASELAPVRQSYEAGFSHESLSDGYSDWHSRYVEALAVWDGRGSLYGRLEQTHRQTDDDQIALGVSRFLRHTTSVSIEADHSPSHHTLAVWSLSGQIEQGLPQGWGVQLALRHREYDDLATHGATVGLERYWGNYRGAYALTYTQVEGTAPEASHRLQLTRYYADYSHVGLSWVQGREVEYLPDTRGHLLFDVYAAAITGRHWFTAHWAATYALTYHHQDRYYERRGLMLGLRYAF